GKCGPAWRRFRKTAGSRTTQKCRRARAPQYTSAPRLRPADTDPAECRSTPAGIAGVRTPPARILQRILPAARSSSLLYHRGRARSRRLLINAGVAVNVRFKFDVGLADGLGVP